MTNTEEALFALETEFSSFVAGKMPGGPPCGQAVGQEGYILRFTGRKLAAVWDAIIAVKSSVKPANVAEEAVNAALALTDAIGASEYWIASDVLLKKYALINESAPGCAARILAAEVRNLRYGRDKTREALAK